MNRHGLALLGGVFCAFALFLLAGAFFVTGGLAAVAGLVLIGWAGLLNRLVVEWPGTVVGRHLEEFGGIREVRLRIVAEEPGVHVGWRGITDQEPPALGARVPLLIPMHRPHRASALMGLARPLAGGPVLLLAGRRIEFDRPHPLLFGRPAWTRRTSDQALELIAELISEGVLSWHRTRCERIAGPMAKSPEFLSLSAAFDIRWPEVVSRALKEQAGPFDQTGASRSRVLGRLGMLAFVAVVVVLPALFAVPDLVRVAAAVLRSLYAGSVEPFRATVHWAAAVHASELPGRDLRVLLGGAALLAAWLCWVTVRVVAAVVGAYRAWHADLTGVVRRRLLDEYRKVANARGEPVLQIRTAPGLAAPDSDQIIARSEADQLRGLTFDLGAGAIAVTGSRGVGKSTLLAALTGATQRATLGLVVSAPVRYNPRDFLLHLYARLCELVLDQLGDRRAGGVLRRLAAYARWAVATLLRAVAVLCLLGVVFTGTRTWLIGHLPLPALNGTWLITGLVLLIVSRWIRGPRPARELALAAEAARRLRQTRYLQTVSSELGGGLSQSSAQLSWRRARQWAEQPHTLPDVVQSYRRFATDVALWWQTQTAGHGKLIIGIDEADRIADPEHAESFVNEIKSVFGIPHCVYLISVSEEALASFERRVVRMRTVFDSAFDHVIRLRPLHLEESMDLLRQRVPGVPDRLWVLCHCLSGGMPRDVLRTARTMFDVHRQSSGSSSLAELAERLVAREVQTVKRGFQRTSGEAGHELGELLATEGWPGATRAELRDAAEGQLGAGSATATAIGAALLYYATILELFTARADLLDGPGPPAVVAGLVRVHGILSFDPEAAVKHLRLVQTHLAGSEGDR